MEVIPNNEQQPEVTPPAIGPRLVDPNATTPLLYVFRSMALFPVRPVGSVATAPGW